ncbi:hypothetical protein FF38_14161 [Lucilia cuprina]|uniref:Uncharacterized protein n=1 Tax=Lucilia cuprina TaxID=7375 RepID=A0A0L0BPC3_LUCCU|nr:hypothetical protein FF38_14161 [Lucilia cuprina]
MFCSVLENQIRNNKQKLNMQHEKTFLSKIISGKIVKKYKCSKNLAPLNIVRKFLENDSNSSIAPGKNDVIKKRGNTFRKRFLQDTLSNLCEKFQTVINCFTNTTTSTFTSLIEDTNHSTYLTFNQCCQKTYDLCPQSYAENCRSPRNIFL